MFLNCFSDVSSTGRLFFSIKHVPFFSSPLKKLFIVDYKRGGGGGGESISLCLWTLCCLYTIQGQRCKSGPPQYNSIYKANFLLKSYSKSKRLKEIALLKCHFKQKEKKKINHILKNISQSFPGSIKNSIPDKSSMMWKDLISNRLMSGLGD